MDALAISLTMDERRSFHSMDRKLYVLLVRDLCRNPVQCLQVIALWIWLERGCSGNVMKQILALSVLSLRFVSKLADEAMSCLMCVKDRSPIFFAAALMPLTRGMFEDGICKQFSHKNWHTVLGEIHNVARQVCIPSLSDLFERACRGGFAKSLSQSEMVVPVHAASGSSQNRLQASPSPHNLLAQRSSGVNIGRAVGPATVGSRPQEVRRSTTTVFITFSKGYPVSEREVSEVCNGLSGNRVVTVKMQMVRRGQQPLFAKVIFHSPSCIDEIVAGGNTAKFTINGKHIRMREYEEH